MIRRDRNAATNNMVGYRSLVVKRKQLFGFPMLRGLQMHIVRQVFKLFVKPLRLFEMVGDCIINNYSIYINNVIFTKYPHISGRIFVKNRGTIMIGSGIYLKSGFRANAVGGSLKMIIYCGPNASIQIGDETGVSNTCIYAEEKIVIGNNVLIGGGCQIYDSDFHNINWRYRKLTETDENIKRNAVIVKDHVFIGAFCIILKGVTIGENSVIGAGSVVTKNVPANEIWAGNPARFIRKVD